MHLCFFEDKSLNNFFPLALTRPVDDFRLGILTIREKWEKELDASSVSRLSRSDLNGVFESDQINNDEPCLWINSRFLPSGPLLKKIKDLEKDHALINDEFVIAANVSGKESRKWLEQGKTDFSRMFAVETDLPDCIEQLWDLFVLNGDEIEADLKRLDYPQSSNTSISGKATLENRERIYIEEGAVVEPEAVLIADEGPIYIGKNATVMAGSMVRGPVAIGDGAIIKMGARIYGETTIGPVCKIGGEVSNTVFHSFSNKAHGGYIGNSAVGQWCNIGAGTTISNLKTNYSNIRASDWITREEIDTGRQFFGIIMGDHSKTAINCVINSGTICGVNCNILSRDFPPKLIPSFSWVGTNVIKPYDLEKALETMQIMMARRDVSISEPYKEMMRQIHKNSRVIE